MIVVIITCGTCRAERTAEDGPETRESTRAPGGFIRRGFASVLLRMAP